MHVAGTDRVILTAISPNMWDDYLVFYDSIRRFHNYPIYVVCLEMIDWQLEEMKKQKEIHIITIDEDRMEDYKKTDPHWRQWFKPFYFKMIPEHETVLWLDSDACALDSLDPLFEQAEKKFFVIADYFAPKTCVNKHELYKKFKLDIPKDKAAVVLNSGVIGIQPARSEDKKVLKEWQRKVNIAAADKEVRSWLALFDQGALLWAMQELDMYSHILARKAWNWPAKKNPYELVTDSRPDPAAPKGWPGSMDGDVLHNIKVDNDGAVFAHFAGLPKLAHLCEPNHVHSLTYFRRKNGGRESKRIFIAGLERGAMRSLAEVFRRTCIGESWVRVNHRPTLAAEAQAKHLGNDYQTPEFEERIGLFNRHDCGLICEANKNLAFFIEEIYERLNGAARFIIMLRDPIMTIRSRMLNFATWPGHLHLAPICYQEDYRKFLRLGLDTTNNYFRIKPGVGEGMSLVDLHIWELEYTLTRISESLTKIPPHAYKFIWAENLRAEIFNVTQFVGGHKLDPTLAEQAARVKYGSGLKIHSQNTADWVESQIEGRTVEIYNRVAAAMHNNVMIPFNGV